MHTACGRRGQRSMETMCRRYPVLMLCTAWLAGTPLAAQQTVTAPRPTPFSIDVGGYYHSLDNGYGEWRGADLRLAYTGARVAPIATVATQHRREGYQNSYGLGSYVTLNRRLYSIVGMSVATGGTAVLFPRLRWDVVLIADAPVVAGLKVAAGLTRVNFGQGGTGSIASLGPIYYRGPLILSATARLNRDGVSGANSGSGELGGQYGSQGRSWVGGSFAAGREAYQTLSATPFDVQFSNIGGAMFYQRWVTRRTALLARLEYQHKLTAYRRRGLYTAYQIAF